MAAARDFASGDFNARVFLKNKDEIGQLADTLNQTAEQLKNSFSELSRQKEELNSIIVSLKEGLLVLDRRGVVLRSNESFRTLAACDSADGKFYWEVLRSPDFTELIDRAKKQKLSLTGEVSLDPRVYACSVTLLESGEKIVAVFHDITEIRNLERVKRDFVVNVSHELRTPLTAIKGFVETLDEEADEGARRYLDIIKRNTNRLINIVNDLLVLSELEEKSKLELETVDLRRLTGDILKIFEPRIKQKGLTISSEIPDALPFIKGDPFKLEQMFVNLLDNAIKYTEKGQIRLTIGSADAKVTILIADTGIGIPKDDLARVFERFYVVDKSRSRKFGGTGLGLSIVKHIVLLHNGSIDVESGPDTGSRFFITLPIDPS
jgi:two-component system phosphate regulon sensor histidine kinase PhoR